MKYSIKKEIVRLQNELIVTIQEDDEIQKNAEKIIPNIKKEAEEQAKKHKLKLIFCEGAKTVAITFSGPEDKIQEAYEFYTSK